MARQSLTNWPGVGGRVVALRTKSGLTQEALANIADTTLDNIRTFLAEGTSVNELCYKCGKLQECGGKKNGKCF